MKSIAIVSTVVVELVYRSSIDTTQCTVSGHITHAMAFSIVCHILLSMMARLVVTKLTHTIITRSQSAVKI
ncbi:MAG: hypothetical protein ACI8RD_000517 [Bacillariaceae sp.]|jgi:hypothetical protein